MRKTRLLTRAPHVQGHTYAKIAKLFVVIEPV